MKKNSIAVFFVSLMCMFMTCPMASAVSERNVVDCAAEGFDTLSFTQAEYKVTPTMARQSDESYVESLIIGFLVPTCGNEMSWQHATPLIPTG